MKVIAPAKINLYLEILGRDRNGYHRIKTVFQSVKLYDEIILSETKHDKIEVACYNDKKKRLKGLSGKKNIVYKTALLLKQQYKVNKGARIRINKSIPVAAGLGGGSSDAAAALSGLNSLWKLRIERNELIHIARKLGADVPFFLFGDTALGEGYGDVVSPFPHIGRKWVLLVKPDFAVKTKWVYDKVNKKKSLTNDINVNRIKRLLRENPGKLLFNRLEEVVVTRYPVINRIKKYLVDNGAEFSMMSGSGPTVFAFVENRKTGIKLKKEIVKMFNCSSWLITT